MDSRTKRRLQRDEIEALVRHAFGSEAKLALVRELTDGMFNASYAIGLRGHSPVVLKVAPAPDTPLLTYEHDIMRTELAFYERVRKETSCPVPRVIASDLTRSIVSSDYFFMEMLNGTPLNKAKRRLSGDELERVKIELGEIAGKLSVIRDERFGYSQPGARAQAATWREAFLAMVANVLQDAERYHVHLPRPPRDILAMFQARAGALDTVTVPILTHFDLWEGNVFIHRIQGVPRVEAIIDGERAFWGDPHAELVSIVLFGDIEAESTSFVRGYEAATGAPLGFTENLRERLLLYRTYLYLLMVAEAAPRGYAGFQYALLRGYYRHKLKSALRRLAAKRQGGGA